jgi:hypothetical protein
LTPNLPPKAIALAWKHGELGYKLRNIQKLIRKKWLASKLISRKFVLNCNRRLGKSTWGLEVLTEGAIKKPGFHGLFCAPVKDSLREYIAPIVTKVIADAPFNSRPVLDSHLVLRFPNGSSITFRGSNAQSYQNLRGNDFDLIFVDEFRNLDDGEDLLKSVLLPAIFNSKGFIIVASTPPDTEEHYLNELNQEAEAGGYYFHCDINDCAEWDKDDFSAAQIEEWRKETDDDIVWTREYLALFIRDVTKTVIPEWVDANIGIPPRDEFFPYYHKYDSMDLGVRDKTAAIFGYYDFKRAKLIIEAEFFLKDAEVLTNNIAERVKTTERDLGYQMIHDRKDEKWKALQLHEKVYRRVADNNNPLLMNDLNSLYGLDFFGTAKDELPAMINLCREWVKNSRILIDSGCTELIGCLRNAVWDKNKKDLARSKVYGHFDALMALVYLVRNVDTQTNPIPKYYGKTWATHSGVPMNASDPQRQGDAMARLFSVKTQRESARTDFVRGKL